MEIRLATLADTDGIATLLGELRGETVDSQQITESLHTIVSDDDRDCIVIVDNDSLVACCVVTIVHKLPKREVRIDEVIVSESVRGKGLGTQLIHAAETWAQQHHGDVIEFTSRPARESANHLYQKLGYHIRETNVYQKNKEDF